MKFKAHSGKLLHRVEDLKHVIEIRENRQYRWMHFGGSSIQSAILLKNPIALVLPYLAPMLTGLKWFHPHASKALVLGLGGGAIIRYLNHCLPKMDITSIEINEQVIHLAQQYFYLNHASHHLLQADAGVYLSTSVDMFDVIFSDIYSLERMPALLLQREYYENAYAHLKPNGIFIVNTICESDNQYLKIMQMVREVFSNQTLTVPVKGYRNIIIYASADPDFCKKCIELNNQGKLQKTNFDMRFGLYAEGMK